MRTRSTAHPGGGGAGFGAGGFFAALAVLLLQGAAFGAERRLTVLFTGDNGGEIADCGCAHNPSGGLARRKTAIDAARKEGPVLVLDSGNALFKVVSYVSDNAQAKAGLIAHALVKMGTAGMAVGARDLSYGPEFLKALAASQDGQTYDSLMFAGESLLELGEAEQADAIFARVLEVFGADPAFQVTKDETRLLRTRIRKAAALREQ